MIVLSWIGIIGIMIGIWNITRLVILDLTWTPYQLRGPLNYGWTYILLCVILSSIGGLQGKSRYV
jgi:hypothetical protein